MPRVGDDEVLVRVCAASAKPWGWDLPGFVQSIGRMTARFHEPKVDVLGLSFAGEVETVGKNVIRFRPGAQVFGRSKGALAEYVSVNEDALTLKPSNVSFVEAATIAVPEQSVRGTDRRVWHEATHRARDPRGVGRGRAAHGVRRVGCGARDRGLTRITGPAQGARLGPHRRHDLAIHARRDTCRDRATVIAVGDATAGSLAPRTSEPEDGPPTGPALVAPAAPRRPVRSRRDDPGPTPPGWSRFRADPGVRCWPGVLQRQLGLVRARRRHVCLQHCARRRTTLPRLPPPTHGGRVRTTSLAGKRCPLRLTTCTSHGSFRPRY